MSLMSPICRLYSDGFGASAEMMILRSSWRCERLSCTPPWMSRRHVTQGPFQSLVHASQLDLMKYVSHRCSLWCSAVIMRYVSLHSWAISESSVCPQRLTGNHHQTCSVNGDNSQNAQVLSSAIFTYSCLCGSVFVFQLSSSVKRLNQMLNLVGAY